MTYRIGIMGTGDARTGGSIPPATITELAGEGFQPELIEPRLNTFPMTPYDRGLTVLANIDCAIEAEKMGFDAVFINAFGDYGIDEMRSATEMLVIGAGEATMAMCTNVGRKFSIVTIWPPKMNFIYHERLRNCGMDDRCVSIINVLTDTEVVGIEGAGATIVRLKAGEKNLVDGIIQAIETAVHSDSADAIALGCTCMAPIGPEIAKRASVPVLESMRTGYKTVETMLSLGIRHGHKAFPKASAANIGALDALIAGQGNISLGGNCEVCVTAKEDAK
ncbi:MAG: aspartate/glutamate racemase family protein [Rhodospirillaceae bacterium]